MRKVILACLIGLIAAALVRGQNRQSPAIAASSVAAKPAKAKNQHDSSPISIAPNAGKGIVATANHTADTVSFVDLNTARVLCEHRTGNGPADIAWSDATTVLVSLLHDDAVVAVRFDRKRAAAQTIATIPVGDAPRSIALAPRRGKAARTAFVALTGEDRVGVIDLATNKLIRRITVGGEPRTIAVSPNGRWLVTCCSVPGEVFVHDTATYRLVSKRTIFDEAFPSRAAGHSSGLVGGHFSSSDQPDISDSLAEH